VAEVHLGSLMPKRHRGTGGTCHSSCHGGSVINRIGKIRPRRNTQQLARGRPALEPTFRSRLWATASFRSRPPWIVSRPGNPFHHTQSNCLVLQGSGRRLGTANQGYRLLCPPCR
jgi:hypothetical protein